MKVILTKDIKGFGRAGEIKEVSDGHVRNFLLPRHLALLATSAALAKVQKEEQEKQEKIKRQQEKFLALKTKLESKIVTLKGRASKEHLFAAIHEKQIAQALMENHDLAIAPEQIIINKPIKSIGQHTVELRLAENLKTDIIIKVEPA